MLMSIVDQVHWTKLHVVHCGVDVREFRPAGGSAHDRGPVKILAVGRLLPLKGHAVLLEAAARLVSDGAPVQITIVGDGHERARLEQLAARLGVDRDVRFAGAVGRDVLPDYYAQADIFCLPSFAEGVPVVLMEAMAAGLPVVATRVAGIPELIRDEQSGLLVSPGRPDLLFAALRRLVESASLRRRIGTAGRARVETEFEVRSCARQLATLMDEERGPFRVLVEPDVVRPVEAHQRLAAIPGRASAG
jgi:glycosyltransferase involved in cell wall biosynthesis